MNEEALLVRRTTTKENSQSRNKASRKFVEAQLIGGYSVRGLVISNTLFHLVGPDGDGECYIGGKRHEQGRLILVTQKRKNRSRRSGRRRRRRKTMMKTRGTEQSQEARELDEGIGIEGREKAYQVKARKHSTVTTAEALEEGHSRCVDVNVKPAGKSENENSCIVGGTRDGVDGKLDESTRIENPDLSLSVTVIFSETVLEVTQVMPDPWVMQLLERVEIATLANTLLRQQLGSQCSNPAGKEEEEEQEEEEQDEEGEECDDDDDDDGGGGGTEKIYDKHSTYRDMDGTNKTHQERQTSEASGSEIRIVKVTTARLGAFAKYANTIIVPKDILTQQPVRGRSDDSQQQFDIIQSDEPPDAKYWHQRYRLFSKFDYGVLLDHELWYSVTPEAIAEHIAERCRCDGIMLDAFAGAGSNAIQFAYTCERVIAIEWDPRKVEMAKHNARVYGVADRIEWIVGDTILILRSLCCLKHSRRRNSNQAKKRASDGSSFSSSSPSSSSSSSNSSLDGIEAVFISPPWGGVHYLENAPSDEGDLPTSQSSPLPPTISPGTVFATNTYTESSEPSSSSSSSSSAAAAAVAQKDQGGVGNVDANEGRPYYYYDLNRLRVGQPPNSVTGIELFELVCNITPNVAYYLPRNVDHRQCGQLARIHAGKYSGIFNSGCCNEGPASHDPKPIPSLSGYCELENHSINGKLKTTTLYFGDFVS